MWKMQQCERELVCSQRGLFSQLTHERLRGLPQINECWWARSPAPVGIVFVDVKREKNMNWNDLSAGESVR